MEDTHMQMNNWTTKKTQRKLEEIKTQLLARDHEIEGIYFSHLDSISEMIGQHDSFGDQSSDDALTKLYAAPACTEHNIKCYMCHKYKTHHISDVSMVSAILNQDFCRHHCAYCASARHVTKELERQLASERDLVEKRALSLAGFCIPRSGVRNPSILIPNLSLNILLNTTDKYYTVLLTAERSDGSDGHIMAQLTKNFHKLYPKCFPVAAAAYSFHSISNNTDGTPTLHGLIRYNCNSKYRISDRSTHIKNIIKIENEKSRLPRHFVFECITNCDNQRNRMTKKYEVERAYQFLESHGNVWGDALELFLRPTPA